MKKFAKMSLVAALAVAGTAASAQPLAEAIKNVDVSGSVVYRYEDRAFKSTKDGSINNIDSDEFGANDEVRKYVDGKDTRNDDVNSNNYKIGLTAKSKVNDDVTAVTRFIVGSDDGSFASLNNSEANGGTGDANVDVALSNVYFSYTGIANTTVNVGKQGLTTPWTVAIDADGNEQTGTGILALTNVGPVTLAAAYFNQTNLDKSGDASIQGSAVADTAIRGSIFKTYNDALNNDKNETLTRIADNKLSYSTGANVRNILSGQDNVMTVGAMANIGPVALDAWYLKMIESFDTYTLGVSSKLDLGAVALSLGARHTVLNFDEAILDNMSDEKQKLTKLMVGAKMGIFDAKLNYGWTGAEGGLVALDNDAKTGMQGWTTQLNGVADAKYLQVGFGAQVLDSLHLALNYHRLKKDEVDNANDFVIRDAGTEKELYLQASYQMSKNFGGYIRLGKEKNQNAYVDEDGDVEDSSGTIGRLQVQYSF